MANYVCQTGSQKFLLPPFNVRLSGLAGQFPQYFCGAGDAEKGFLRQFCYDNNEFQQHTYLSCLGVDRQVAARLKNSMEKAE